MTSHLNTYQICKFFRNVSENHYNKEVVGADLEIDVLNMGQLGQQIAETTHQLNTTFKCYSDLIISFAVIFFTRSLAQKKSSASDKCNLDGW